MILQLFENIISNALKYSRENIPARLSINCIQTKDSVELSFEDNGIGFDEQYMPQMFTLFQRLHGRGKYEGTGLGLAICQKIVERNGGRIWVKSDGEGSGSTFYFTLPEEALR